MRRLFIFIVCNFIILSSYGQPSNDKDNWISIYIWDAFAPLTLDKSVPEMLSSLEVIFQQHATYTTKKKANKKYGSRSTEGHFMVWIHLSDSFYQQHGLARDTLPEKVYLFKDRETDIFTAWCGQANFRDFILDGVSGLCNQTVLDDGTISGELDVFESALNMGDATYGAGFYLSDEQALNIVNAIKQYPGFDKGYSFLSRKRDRPEQADYEHASAQAVNGYNCNDFAFYLLEKGDLLSKQASENLKVEFWYPQKYWDHTIPLAGSGKRIFKKFDADRNLYMSREKILALAWSELLFSGLDIFDELSLIQEIKSNQPSFNKVRLWDQETMINYLKNPNNRDFRSRLVLEELKKAVEKNKKITKPYKTNIQLFNFRASKPYVRYRKGTKKRTARKLRKMGLQGKALKQYREQERLLKQKSIP